MAKKTKKTKIKEGDSTADEVGNIDFTSDLIASLNKEHGCKVAYNLATDSSPTHIKRWISTGSRLLDYIVSNKRDGGLPESRIVEIFGPPSIGKSHIAIQIAVATQKAGGIVVYIDTENATSIENLSALGVDIRKRFVYVDTHCTEEVLSIAESTILKAKSYNKDVPITVIWDSVAASSPKAELMGDYDKDSIGLQARAISKGMRKITGIISGQRVLFVCLNQIRVKIGIMFGDPTVVPGGSAIPFHSSVRIKLGAGQHITNADNEPIGIHVSAKIIKNKIAPPFRDCKFEIHFGVGIKEHEQIFDLMRTHGPEKIGDKIVNVHGSGSWKYLDVSTDDGEVLLERKFYKKDFDKILEDPEAKPYCEDLLEVIMTRKMSSEGEMNFDGDSYVEAQAFVDMIGSDLQDPEE
jgi:recombination protein RecA